MNSLAPAPVTFESVNASPRGVVALPIAFLRRLTAANATLTSQSTTADVTVRPTRLAFLAHNPFACSLHARQAVQASLRGFVALLIACLRRLVAAYSTLTP